MATLKHIVFTITNDITYDRRMQRIAKALCSNGFKVTIIGRKLSSSKPLSKEVYQQKRLSCFFNKGKLFYVEYNIRLFFTLLFIHADIFSAVDLDTIVPIYFASLLRNKKRVFDAHEYFEEVPEVVNRKSVQQFWKWVAKTFIPQFHQCYTVGDSLATLFQQQYHVSFKVVKNVPDYIPQSNTTIGNYLLYQGALNEGRGLEQMIEAMQSINMTLKIVGEGDLSNYLRDIVRQKNLSHKIEFLGFVKPENLYEVTRHAFIGLNLLENKGLSYYHSLANKFFDYIQAEVPLITMNFPEYQAVNKQYEVACLINDLQTETIANAVKHLQNDKALYLKLKQQCSAAKKHFHWQEESKKLIKLYNSL